MCLRNKIIPILTFFMTFFIITSLSVAEQSIFSVTNGNRFIKGNIDLKHSKQRIVKFHTYPTWIVGYGHDDLSVWYILLSDSTIQKVVIGENSSSDVTPVDFTLPADSILALI